MLELCEESWVMAGRAWGARPLVELSAGEAEGALFDRQQRQKAGWREDRNAYEL